MGIITAFFEAIPKWVWVAIVAVLSATSCKLHYSNGQLEIEVHKAATKVAEAQGETQKLKTDYALSLKSQSEAFAVATEATRKKEQDLQLALNVERKKTNEAVYALAGESDAVRVRLLKDWGVKVAGAAPKVASVSATPGTPETTALNYVPELPPAIGELVEEAKRADVIRLELLGCYRSYDEAREKLRGTPDTGKAAGVPGTPAP
jgi:hypothetical protein